ncbi:MAG: sodium-dependent transporter [Longimicrobiales bacterium]|nr:sodium-dependent transporter [Longimicrobiales bacterium]
MSPSPAGRVRETFGSRLGVLATMIGVAVGLGNVWRFPYMAGRHGGGAFVLLYLAIALLVGVPALMAEWSLGRHTRRGTLEAYRAAGLPAGRAVGWTLCVIVLVALGYYNAAIGWVLWHAVAEAAAPFGRPLAGAAILPPESGFAPGAFLGQAALTAVVLAAQATVLVLGLRRGVERASRVLTPLLFLSLLVLAVRSLTLPGAGEGVRWLLAFHPGELSVSVALAALGQVVFSLALGGTFMVTYGSYLADDASLRNDAALTVLGDTGAGILAGLAIFPAVFAFGLEPASGPGLLFDTVPRVFAQLPAGWLFGLLFFAALGGAALLSGIAAFQVLVDAADEVLGWERRRAVRTLALATFVLALPPMVNLRIFVPWDLTFGSGGQTFGAVVAVVTVGWALHRGHLLRQLGGDHPGPLDGLLAWWLRWIIPAAVAGAAAWWLLTDVFGAVAGV